MRSSASFQDSNQTRSDLQQPLLTELNGYTFEDVAGFSSKYFKEEHGRINQKRSTNSSKTVMAANFYETFPRYTLRTRYGTGGTRFSNNISMTLLESTVGPRVRRKCKAPRVNVSWT